MPRRGAAPITEGLIIMTRTRIIAADGTQFVPVGRGARIARRTAYFAFLIITALFLSAAVIGLQRAAIDADQTPHAAPTATKAIALSTARKACKPAGARGMQDCLNLYMRSAWATPSTFTPAGPALVRECISQYRGAELRDCFTQEIG